jgi:energy-coupling factor transporter ATPase
VIQVRDLSFSYWPGGPRVLDGVTLAIESGEWVGLVGANGSGKSTLVRHFNGLLVPDRGTVTVDGLDVRSRADRPAIRQRIGLVFQNPENQIVGTIVEDDVAFGPENLGLSSGEIRERVDAALAATGLAELSARSPSTLSGGQKQRLAIASVLAIRPAHLVLDEPLTMLDPRGRAEVLSVLGRLNRENGITVVFVTHALEELLPARRVVALARGKVAFDGPASEFLKDPGLHERLDLEVPPSIRMMRELAGWGVLSGDLPRDAGELVESLCS